MNPKPTSAQPTAANSSSRRYFDTIAKVVAKTEQVLASMSAFSQGGAARPNQQVAVASGSGEIQRLQTDYEGFVEQACTQLLLKCDLQGGDEDDPSSSNALAQDVQKILAKCHSLDRQQPSSPLALIQAVASVYVGR